MYSLEMHIHPEITFYTSSTADMRVYNLVTDRAASK